MLNIRYCRTKLFLDFYLTEGRHFATGSKPIPQTSSSARIKNFLFLKKFIVLTLNIQERKGERNRKGRREERKRKGKQKMTENELSNRIIGAAIKIHTGLGPGLLESAYKECLLHELKSEGLAVVKEKPMPLVYKDVKLDCGYRIDILVENKVVVELKSVDALNDIHMAQILTYLRLGNFKLGLLINFNVALLKNGIRRVANGI